MPLSLYTARMTKLYKQEVIITGKVGMHIYDYIHNHPNKTHNKYQCN